jgi:hypothetical protein
MKMSNPFHRVYWLSGSPCAGKTTLAKRLATRFGWRIYHCDDWFADHRERACPDKQPTFHRVSRLRGDALWLRPVAEQIATEIRFAGEEFTLVRQDIEHILAEDKRPLLFDGAAALPHLLQPWLPHPSHAFWLIPSEPFQRRYYAKRPWIKDILAATSDPAQAFDNWMNRDAGFARWLETQVTTYNMPWLKVDGSLTLEATAEHVARHFQPQVRD